MKSDRFRQNKANRQEAGVIKGTQVLRMLKLTRWSQATLSISVFDPFWKVPVIPLTKSEIRRLISLLRSLTFHPAESKCRVTDGTIWSVKTLPLFSKHTETISYDSLNKLYYVGEFKNLAEESEALPDFLGEIYREWVTITVTLTRKSSPEIIYTYSFTDDSFYVGRDAERCKIAIPERNVARMQMEIKRQPDDSLILISKTDLAEMRVNGKPVRKDESVTLQQEDDLQIGSYHYRLSWKGPRRKVSG